MQSNVDKLGQAARGNLILSQRPAQVFSNWSGRNRLKSYYILLFILSFINVNFRLYPHKYPKMLSVELIGHTYETIDIH